MLINRIIICITLCLLFASQNILASTLLELNETDEYKVSELNLWHKINLIDHSISFETLKNAYKKTSAIKHSTVTTTGSYVAKISLVSRGDSSENWYVMPTANFIDKGVAFLEKTDGTVIPLHEFSQLNDLKTPVFMHGQTFSFNAQKNETYALWIFVNAKIYAYPLSVSVFSEQSFIKSKFINNSITVFTIAIMLTLSLIALMSYFSTQNFITLACSIYIGIHGIGWLVASGLLNDIFTKSTTNFTYGGIFIYPLAVSAASQYTKLLFDCDKRHPNLAILLNRVTITSFIIGVLLPLIAVLLPLIAVPIAFFVSHIIAASWILLCTSIGIKMFSLSNRRSIYYLLGNTCYAVSMGIYVLSHFKIIESISLPELWVVIALAFDCFCILLSLFSWLYHHPKHNPVYRPIT